MKTSWETFKRTGMVYSVDLEKAEGRVDRGSKKGKDGKVNGVRKREVQG